MKRIWEFFSSTALTIILAILICIVAAWGSVVCIRNSEFFQGLDRAVLLPWLFTEGTEALALTLWIFVLVFLIFFFALNTVICTLDRLYSIIKQKRPWQSFFPHIVHIGFLVALLGHLLGSSYGFRSSGNIVFKGEPLSVPHTEGLSVRLEDVEIDYTPSGDLERLKTTVTLLEGDKEALTDTIEINGPLIYRGIAFYHVDHGKTPTGLVLDVDGEKKSVKLGGSFITRDGRIFSLGALYPDFGVQEIISEWRERAFLNISVTGTFVTLGGKTITLKGYETTPFAILTINRDPGIWLMIAGSSILVLGMVLLLFLRGERGELVRHGGAG
jgi:cytochrome c biogenesis protein